MINDRVMRLSAWVALVLALLAALPARASFAQADSSPLPAARLEPFAYGVAAGDLTSGSVVLWTRTPGPASVVAELAASETFENPTALPAVPATAATDFTVKVVATGLKPGTQYYYRFKADDAVSPVGTFKTPYGLEVEALPAAEQPDTRKARFFLVPGRSYLRNDRSGRANIRRRSGGLSLEVPRKP